MKRLAIGLLNGELMRQSYLAAFVDVFYMLTMIFVLLLPFVFLLRGKPPTNTAPAMR